MTNKHLSLKLVLFCGLLISCSSVPQPGVLPESLDVKVLVRTEMRGNEPHPIATVTVTNRSPKAIAFSKTFGITNNPWLSFEIVSGNKKIYYPTEIDAFRESPSYICLAQGEQLKWNIDLLNWKASWGGKLSDETYGFELPVGHYVLRAHYADFPERIRASCPGIHGVVSSPWAEFEVSHVRQGPG